MGLSQRGDRLLSYQSPEENNSRFRWACPNGATTAQLQAPEERYGAAFGCSTVNDQREVKNLCSRPRQPAPELPNKIVTIMVLSAGPNIGPGGLITGLRLALSIQGPKADTAKHRLSSFPPGNRDCSRSCEPSMQLNSPTATEPHAIPAGGDLPSSRCFPLLIVLFVGSGCSALIYEIVWLQMLQLVIGSSAISLGVLLGTFMGGMCLGSLALPRLISPARHPLRVYAALELGIGAMGILLLLGMPYVNRIYLSYVGHGMPSVLLCAVACVICLLPPTILMGATLPAIARWMETTRQDISRLGFFYGSNIAGAVLGCVLAGFYLLRVHDVATATYTAVAINAVIGFVGLVVAARVPHRAHTPRALSVHPQRAFAAWPAYVAVAISGMCSLGAEVIWTRQLSLLLGATVYSFSIILAVFLVGLGIGSSIGAVVCGKIRDPRIALGSCQLLVVFAVAWTAYQLAESLPYWPIDVSLPTPTWLGFQIDLIRCLWAFLPASFLWGASFPLALASAAARGQDPGRLVGGIYAANTIGAIVGALGFSMIAVAWLGTQQAQQLIMVLAAVSAFVVFGAIAVDVWRGTDVLHRTNSANQKKRKILALATTLFVGAVALSVLVVPQSPPALIAYGRNLPTWYNLPDFIYSAEGMNASIAVSQFENGVRNFHVSGKVVASTEMQDMRLQRMLGHLPALLHPDPKSVLVVGCGAGVTAGSFIVHPTIERIVVCEIEPLIPRAATKYFGQENYHLLDDPRVEVIYDDARHYVATTTDRFDIITSDPIHPWVKGAAALYSKEYHQLCQERLTPGGIVTQWVPLYETTLDVVQSEMATFFEVFPDGTVWSNLQEDYGYDVILLGQNGETIIDTDELQLRLDRSDHRPVVESLRAVMLDTSLSLLATYAGRAADLKPWLEGAEINYDRSLRLQYLAGMGLNHHQEEWIYLSMVAHGRVPKNVFLASGIRGRALRAILEAKFRTE